jgi:predicted nucleic acid-binding protein
MIRFSTRLDGPSLQSLDAIHLAAAQALGAELESVVTYDARMRGAATTLGLRVTRPT